MPAPAAPRPPVRGVSDKRRAILDAALRLIARAGLHDAPMSALAQNAGVGAGTVYRYFPSKAALVNALYLELLEARGRALRGDGGAAPTEPAGTSETSADPRALLSAAWHGLARWHLDHPEASNFVQQCRATGILTGETRAAEQRLEMSDLAAFDAGVAHGLLRPMSRQVFYALFAGPITQLVQMRDAGELDVAPEVLRATFDGVCRTILPALPALRPELP